MKNPIPTNRLVAFTLAGALLTGLVAAGLAFPVLGFAQPTDSPSASPGDDITATQQVAEDAPAANQDFTPAVKTDSRDEEEHEEEEYEEDEYEDEEYEEEHEEEEYAEDAYEEEVAGYEDEYEADD